MTIGEKIKKLRKEKHLTQEELGEMIGVQKAAINKYETGIVVNLKREVIAKLAKAFDVNPVWLMDEDDDWPPVPSTATRIARAFYENDLQRIVVPNTDEFRKIMENMSYDDLVLVTDAFKRTEQKMKENGII
jgi:transcriptional regulator with XRE-family HTH domain